MSPPSDNIPLISKAVINRFRASLMVQDIVVQSQGDCEGSPVNANAGVNNSLDTLDFGRFDKPNFTVINHASPPDCEGVACADLKFDSSKIFSNLVNPAFANFGRAA